MREEIQDTKEIKMDPITLAQEIIDGRRITRDDDLSFFLTCDLDELCKGADMIREKFIGDKVDLCSKNWLPMCGKRARIWKSWRISLRRKKRKMP